MSIAAIAFAAVLILGSSQPEPAPPADAAEQSASAEDSPPHTAARPAPESAPPQAEPRQGKSKLPPGFQLKDVTLDDGTVYKYGLFVPPQYDLSTTHKWPVILFLHGSGEVGSDGLKQLKVGLPPRIGTRSDRFPFITICPQAHTKWFHDQDAAAVWKILDTVMREYRTDPDRVYLTGLSMGGFATWEFACAHPDKFAAIAPVCGAGPIEFMCNIMHLPTWVFHGEADPAVPVENSRTLVAELKRLGAEPKYTEYANVGHNSWDQAYANADLYRWFLKQRRPVPPRVIAYKAPGRVAQAWWLSVETRPDTEAVPYVHAEIADGNRVNIQSTGIAAFQLMSDAEPLPPGSQIQINWNGVDVFKGTFEGTLLVRPKDPAALPEGGKPKVSEPERGKVE